MRQTNTLRLRLTPPERETVEEVIDTTPGWSVTPRREGNLFVLEDTTEGELERLIDELYRFAQKLSGNQAYDLADTAKSTASKLEREVTNNE